MFARLMGLKPTSPTGLHRRMQKEPVTVIDVTSRESWRTAHVPGARHPGHAEYDENDLPADRDAMLVFYRTNFICRKAPKAARRAKRLGYRRVHVMSAGIRGWLSAALPTESGD
jgi:rhodanese-related sulfurtransferase